MRYTSASGMRFKDRNGLSVMRNKLKTLLFFCCILLITHHALHVTCYAEVIDRVVAYVDETAVTLSELRNYYLETKETANITEEEALNSIINRLLLLKEARAMKLEAQTDDELLKDYINIKIGSAILIKEDTIISFYNEHLKEFEGKDYLTVRDIIEKYLFEAEINRRLKKHLDELRANAEVKIQAGSKR